MQSSPDVESTLNGFCWALSLVTDTPASVWREQVTGPSRARTDPNLTAPVEGGDTWAGAVIVREPRPPTIVADPTLPVGQPKAFTVDLTARQPRIHQLERSYGPVDDGRPSND